MCTYITWLHKDKEFYALPVWNSSQLFYQGASVPIHERTGNYPAADNSISVAGYLPWWQERTILHILPCFLDYGLHQSKIQDLQCFQCQYVDQEQSEPVLANWLLLALLWTALAEDSFSIKKSIIFQNMHKERKKSLV